MRAHFPVRLYFFDIIYVLLYIKASLCKNIALKVIAVTIVKFFWGRGYLIIAYSFISRSFCREISWFEVFPFLDGV